MEEVLKEDIDKKLNNGSNSIPRKFFLCKNTLYYHSWIPSQSDLKFISNNPIKYRNYNKNHIIRRYRNNRNNLLNSSSSNISLKEETTPLTLYKKHIPNHIQYHKNSISQKKTIMISNKLSNQMKLYINGIKPSYKLNKAANKTIFGSNGILYKNHV